MGMTLDPTPPVPLTTDERKTLIARAAAGEIPTLETCRRFIATIRSSISLTPAKTAKAAKSRTKVSPTTEDQIDFF